MSEWKWVETRDYYAILQCRQCGIEILSKSYAELDIGIGVLYRCLGECNDHIMHNVVGYRMQMKEIEMEEQPAPGTVSVVSDVEREEKKETEEVEVHE